MAHTAVTDLKAKGYRIRLLFQNWIVSRFHATDRSRFDFTLLDLTFIPLIADEAKAFVFSPLFWACWYFGLPIESLYQVWMWQRLPEKRQRGFAAAIQRSR